MESLNQEVKLFLEKVLDYAEGIHGKEGLIKLQTAQGMIEYMKKYLDANQSTFEKFISSPSQHQKEFITTLMHTVYARINAKPHTPNKSDN